uniref:Uncharacterized protein ycf20 n=1 Tax=Rhodosorus marinus TaxID=101924 RepID=A0A7S3ELZ1_9RHOD|mmetsp:Transcript_44054/g.171931  ORF Transcript_44054/g.171931 Transcript_44054/m.171931 type:complete len:155 (+) Transcript_44054:130-594(+)
MEIFSFILPMAATHGASRLLVRRLVAEEDIKELNQEELNQGSVYKPTRARAVLALPRTIVKEAEFYFKERPRRLLTAGAIAVLMGFFGATSAATIIGSVADWDPLAAAVLLFWTETFTRVYYMSEKKTIPMKLINAFKIGLVYGMAVEAMKLGT